MSHVPTKLLAAAVAAFAIITSSCNGSDDSAAQALLDQAETALDEGHPALTVELIDSIKNAYPRAIDVRKKSLHVMAKAQEALTRAQLETADSTLAVLFVRADSLQQLLKKVDNPIEPYYVAEGIDPAAARSTSGLHARVSLDGDLYLIATLKGVDARSTAVTVTDASGRTVRTPDIAFDGERNDRSSGLETITFLGAECEETASFITMADRSQLRITFEGARPYTMTLPQAQAEAIATLYNAAATLRALRVASVEKERATRALDLSRSQAARTFPEDDQAQTE